MNESSSMTPQTHPMKLLLSLALGYARWAVVTPMILMWGVAVITLLAMLFTALGDQGWTVAETIGRFVAGIPVIGPEIGDRIRALFESDAPFEQMLIRLMLGTWAMMSVVFAVLGWGVNALFGPFKPWTLRRKLALVAVACLLIPVSFRLLQLAAPDRIAGWVAGFLWIPVFFVVSAVCLWLSQKLAEIDQFVQGLDLGGQEDRPTGL